MKEFLRAAGLGALLAVSLPGCKGCETCTKSSTDKEVEEIRGEVKSLKSLIDLRNEIKSLRSELEESKPKYGGPPEDADTTDTKLQNSPLTQGQGGTTGTTNTGGKTETKKEPKPSIPDEPDTSNYIP